MVDTGNSGVYRLWLCDLRINIHAAADDRTCANQLDQFADSVRRSFAEVRVDALFIPSGSLGPQHQSLGCRSDAVGGEVRGFDDDGFGIRLDFGIQAAHDACDRDRFFRVVDHQHCIIQGSFGTVEGHEFFAVTRGIDDDPPARETFNVKGVQRLPVFEHDEVGDVDDIVDRPHPRVDQSSLQPPWGILHLDVLDDSGNISSAERGLDFNLDIVFRVSLLLLAGGLRITQLRAKGRGSFSCHTDHGQAVRSVRGDFKVDDGVLELHRFRKVAAERIFLFEDPDALSLIDRHDLVLKAQLAERAEHAVGFHASEAALGDEGAALLLRLTMQRSRNPAAVQRDRHICTFKHVRRTGDDLNRRVLADIDLTNN